MEATVGAEHEGHESLTGGASVESKGSKYKAERGKMLVFAERREPTRTISECAGLSAFTPSNRHDRCEGKPWISVSSWAGNRLHPDSER